jgi:hypothetical protein
MSNKRKKSNRGKLKRCLEVELEQPVPNIEKILDIIDYYETDNLLEIDRLSRIRVMTEKKIRGALKSTISIHGPITMDLIQSATKRIYGTCIEDVKNESTPTETKSIPLHKKLIECIVNHFKRK